MKKHPNNKLKKASILTFFTSKKDGNLAFHVNDDRTRVITNHKTLAIKHNYNFQNLVHMKQIHSDIVHIVQKEDNFENPPTCDALITNKKNIPLMVMVADCTPVLFYDEIKSVIGVAHAGRQGAFSNIVKKVILSFKDTFGSKVDTIKVKVGASICPSCYEVGAEINTEAISLGFHYAIMKKNNRFYLDVNAILLTQLKQCGIIDKNIDLVTECSACNNKKYYSYRREGQTGRFAGVITLV